MKILAIGAHPDDIEVCCGGTMAKYRKQGHEVSILYACTGDKGDFTIEPDRLANIRSQEARESGATIGANVNMLGYKDGEILYTEETLGAMIDAIRNVNPDVIFTHYPEDYHLDHATVSKLAIDASFLVSVPSMRPATAHMNHVPQIYFMETYTGIGFVPTEYVDITDELTQKLDMMRCHKSQLRWLLEHDGQDVLDFLLVNAKYRGYQCGVPYAESFVRYITGLRAVPGYFLP